MKWHRTSDKDLLIRSFKFRLYPTRKQSLQMRLHLGICRELYNAALQERRDAWRLAKKSIRYLDQQNALPEVKQSRPDVAEVHSQVLQNVLQRVNLAFEGFFKRLKENKGKAGYPRFRHQDSYFSMCFSQATKVRVEARKLHLPWYGKIKVKAHRLLQGTPKTLTLFLENDKWYASISCEMGEKPKIDLKPKTVRAIDLGLKSLVTDSQGGMIAPAKHYRSAESQLAMTSRKFAASHYKNLKLKNALKALHQKVKNQRIDFLHKLSNLLLKDTDLLGIEDLKIRNMVKSSNFSKSIYDASWGRLKIILAYKAESAGKLMISVDPTLTSQFCSGCKTKVRKTLGERWHKCHHCCLELDRDVNAARNILARAIEQAIGTYGLEMSNLLEAPAIASLA